MAVSQADGHGFSKQPRLWITLRAGLGVEGGAHAGVTVKHRSRVARDASRSNLRHVHLLQAELLGKLAARVSTSVRGRSGRMFIQHGVGVRLRHVPETGFGHIRLPCPDCHGSTGTGSTQRGSGSRGAPANYVGA